MNYATWADGPPNRPNCLLAYHDFIALKMQAHPGESMSYYLRALSQYENGYVPEPVKGYARFMDRAGIYWTNSSPARRRAPRSKGSWTLTQCGVELATHARRLIYDHDRCDRMTERVDNELELGRN